MPQRALVYTKISPPERWKIHPVFHETMWKKQQISTRNTMILHKAA